MEWKISGRRTAAGGTRLRDHRRIRIALYSHDTVGIGHLRRNLRIARHLVTSATPADILLITGAREAGSFAMPGGVDCLTLPSLRKDDAGQYVSRSLGIGIEQLIDLRSATLTAALGAFGPDLLIVDKVPRGVLGELDVALEILREGGRTHCVLGLRDVLDDPETVGREWNQHRSQQAVRDYYDAIWVYGDPQVYDPIREYGLDTGDAARIRYTGYLAPCEDLPLATQVPGDPLQGLGLPPGRLALCVVGGGQDGAALAAAFCDAHRPSDMNGVLVTGPFMPEESRARLRHIAARQPRFRILEFVADPERLMRSADRVISMGGYNTVSEVLALGKQALIVPRVQPRREQLIRAERLSNLNLVDVLRPDELSPAALSDWLSRGLPPRPIARKEIDLGGLLRLPQLVNELIAGDANSPRMSCKLEVFCDVAS